MATSLHNSTYGDLDIDPNSTLAIRVCIKSIARSRSQSLFSTTGSEQNQNEIMESGEALAEHIASRGKAKTTYSDMTLDRVMSMSPGELAALHKRVQQLELSNYGLLRRIYGAQISAAPYVQFNGHDPSASNDNSEAYRVLLFEQYQRMMTVARDPYMPDLEPASVEGNRLLKLFLFEFKRLTTARHSSPQSPSSAHSPLHARPSSRDSHGRIGSRVDKKATQAYKSRLEHINIGHRTQSTALTDYQVQLMILEEQNQKRLALMRSQRQNATTPAFDPILYEAQLAAIKVMNHKRIEQQLASPVEELHSPVDTDTSLTADTEMSGGDSPVIESIESPIIALQPIKLPARGRKGKPNSKT
jgi:hypothetical protein